MGEMQEKRILIVDNDEEESRMLQVMLRQAGYDPITTWSGLKALELFKSQTVDILLVSSYLPDLYIGDFLERLRGLPVKPCAIVMREGHDIAAELLKVANMRGEKGLPEK